MKEKVIIGSRGSDLALWQANYVTNQLQKLGIEVQLEIIVTKGDAIQDLSFDKLEGKGFFTKEIEDALLEKKIDLAVHSFKDLPTNQPHGLTIAAMSYREDPAELLLIQPHAYDNSLRLSLKYGAVVGTSSARRKSQLMAMRPDLIVKDLRGNVPTRVDKLSKNQYDAIMLANAGVSRLQLPLDEFVALRLDPLLFIPAPAQGVLALQIRDNDHRMQHIATQLHQADVANTVSIERELLHLFKGGCQMPLAIYCTNLNDSFQLHVSHATNASEIPIRFTLTGTNPPILTKKALFKATNREPKSVFITKDSKQAPLFFNTLRALGYKVEGRSMIQYNQINQSLEDQVDGFCFSSERAVHFTNVFGDFMREKMVFAIGNTTARALLAKGITPTAVGNGHPKETAETFLPLMQGKRIAFPQSNISAKSIQKKLGPTVQTINWVVYETTKVITSPVEATIYVVTSPSNFESLIANHFPVGEALLVAIGPTTRDAIHAKGFACVMAIEPDEIFLAQAVCSLF